METVFEGAPHEMVTIYHDQSDRTLSMTHYCMLNNQPKMRLTTMEGNELRFDLSEDADIVVAKEMHMHALTIKVAGKDTMIQEWTNFEGGKQKEVVEIAYNRIK